MNTPKPPKRSGAFISTAKVLIIAASLAATVGGWAAMSAPAVAATPNTTTTTRVQTSSNGLLATLSQILSPSPAGTTSQPTTSTFQPAIRTRSSR